MKTVAVCDWDGRAAELAQKVAGSPFDRVVLCIEDRHVKWRKDNVKEAVSLFQEAGLEVVADPWAVGGLFAGESYGDVNNSNALSEWLTLIAETTSDGILWDEPHHIEDLTNYLDLAQTITPHMKNILALQPERELADWVQHPQVAEVSLSAYFFPPRITTITAQQLDSQVEQWAERLGGTGSAWVQNWGLPEGCEWIPGHLIKTWQKHGIDVNIWAWDSFSTVGDVRPTNHQEVWSRTVTSLR
jgi:hypothetical protein